MSKLGIGVAGVGEMGQRHAENVCRLSNTAELVAIADVSFERAAKVASTLGVSRAFGSLEAMLACKEIQAIVLAMPDKFHAAAVCLAAQAGKDILCEKPIALSLPEAENALKVVAQSGVRMQVGFMRRYDPNYKDAMARIQAGEIGEPVIFKSVGRDKDAPSLAAYESGMNGTMFYNASIHDFDLARWIMSDEVIQVQAATTVMTRPEVANFNDMVAGLVNLKFAKGAIGSVECFAQACYGYDVRSEIVGSKGSLMIGTLDHGNVTMLTTHGRTKLIADHFLTRFADAYLAEMADFIDTISRDRPVSVTGEDGLKALQIAVAADESQREARVVNLPL